MQEKIEFAAILDSRGKVWTGQRHHAIFRQMHESCADHIGAKQGFQTNFGRFVDREEAMQIALKNNQLLGKPYNKNKLFSEDLW
jgi:hypothetical protein